MKNLFVLFIISSFFISCDDGDFDVPSFTFGTNVADCGELILFNINGSEALILELNENNANHEFYSEFKKNEIYNLNNIRYRVFNGNVSGAYFCQDIPPNSPSIVEEWNGNGNLVVNNFIRLDDNDGISSIVENGGVDPYTDEDGDLIFHYLDDDDTDATIGDDDHLPQIDTDGDNISNFYDLDDDNDGIKTIKELERDINDVLITDTNGNNIPMQTDTDSIPDYLDTDDDNDSIPTLNELRTDSNLNGINDYLDDSFAVMQPNVDPIEKKIDLSYVTTFIIEDMSLTNSNGNVINYERYEFGGKTGTIPMVITP